MQEPAIWEGRSSPLLFVYEYIVIFLVAAFVHRQFGGHLYLLAVAIAGYFFFKARSMKYSMSRSEIYCSPSIGESEELTVRLNEILAIHIIDRQPWSFFRLGTLILIIDPGEDMHPCFKCLKDPHALAQRIRRTAVAAGAENFDIEVAT